MTAPKNPYRLPCPTCQAAKDVPCDWYGQPEGVLKTEPKWNDTYACYIVKNYHEARVTTAPALAVDYGN
jgi:hypothetical protein